MKQKKFRLILINHKKLLFIKPTAFFYVEPVNNSEIKWRVEKAYCQIVKIKEEKLIKSTISFRFLHSDAKRKYLGSHWKFHVFILYDLYIYVSDIIRW